MLTPSGAAAHHGPDGLVADAYLGSDLAQGAALSGEGCNQVEAIGVELAATRGTGGIALRSADATPLRDGPDP